MGNEPAVMLQVHADDSFLRFIRAAGRPVIGPPMTEEEAARITA